MRVNLASCVAFGLIVLVNGVSTASRPNIIFIMGDDVGYGDLSCYGATKIETPNIDELAREGVRFTDAHTPAAVCTPTRYGVLTGRYAWRTRLKAWTLSLNGPLLIAEDEFTVASLLKSKGYATGCFGKWHLGFGRKKPDWNGELRPGPVEVGFDYYFGVPTSSGAPPFVWVENHGIVGKQEGERIEFKRRKVIQGIAAKRKNKEIGPTLAAKACKFIERHKDHPFFIYLPTCAVHTPYTPAPFLRGTSQCGVYGDFVREFDWTVGEVLKALDALHLRDNTLVIVTSDNGANDRWFQKFGHRSCGLLRGQKADIWEGGHRVPFVARWPGRIPAGSTCSETICLTDLMATAAAIVGTKLPDDAGVDSYNIFPALLGKKLDKPIREATVHHSGAGHFAIRQGSWKLIPKLGSGGFSKPRRVKPKPGEPQGQLYNLAEDPQERKNLYEERPEIVARLSTLLKKYKNEGRSRHKTGQ